MFADPQSITVSGNAKSMPRIGTKNNSSEYLSADGNWKLVISHEMKGSETVRSVAKFSNRKIVADPLDAEKSAYKWAHTLIIMERPEVGWTEAEITAQITGQVAWIGGAGVYAKLFGKES